MCNLCKGVKEKDVAEGMAEGMTNGILASIRNCKEHGCICRTGYVCAGNSRGRAAKVYGYETVNKFFIKSPRTGAGLIDKICRYLYNACQEGKRMYDSYSGCCAGVVQHGGRNELYE